MKSGLYRYSKSLTVKDWEDRLNQKDLKGVGSVDEAMQMLKLLREVDEHATVSQGWKYRFVRHNGTGQFWMERVGGLDDQDRRSRRSLLGRFWDKIMGFNKDVWT